MDLAAEWPPVRAVKRPLRTCLQAMQAWPKVWGLRVCERKSWRAIAKAVPCQVRTLAGWRKDRRFQMGLRRAETAWLRGAAERTVFEFLKFRWGGPDGQRVAQPAGDTHRTKEQGWTCPDLGI